MRKRISAMLLVLAMVITTILSPLQAEAAQEKVSDYKVITPENYDESRSYPVVYIMPEDGYKMDNSGMVEKFQAAMKDGTSTDMIIVTPAFDEGTDLHAAMENLVAEVDANYKTIASAEGRAIVGTGVGGYLAYILGLTEKVVEVSEPSEDVTPTEEVEVTEDTEPATEEVEATEDTEPAAEEAEPAAEEVSPAAEEVSPAAEEAEPAAEEAAPAYTTLSAPNLFKYVASTRGDFVSDENQWYATYGDVYSYLNTMGSTVAGNFDKYLDAPVNDKYTDMENSSDDIGQLLIRFDKSGTAQEFTVRKGSYSNSFLEESVNRIAARLTSTMLANTVNGSVSLSTAALPGTVETAEAKYSVSAGRDFSTYATEEDVKIKISVLDSNTEEVLTTTETTGTLSAGKNIAGTADIKNIVNGASATVQLSVEILGVEKVLATTTLVRIQDNVIDGDYQYMDLMGEWYFNYVGYADVDVASLTVDEYSQWLQVQPALCRWSNGYGNISSDTVRAGIGSKYPTWSYYVGYGFDNYLTWGSGYYLKEFELPEGFDSEEFVISIGYVDDRCEVFLNGKRIAATGMDENGEPTGESTWAKYTCAEISKDDLVDGTNVLVVRAYNDGGTYGEGGWYDGPVALYSKEAFESENSVQSRFIESSFESEYIAKELGVEGTVENEFLVYLPEDYYETERYYPTMYLLHQFNSDHTSYITDDIDAIMDDAIKQAVIDGMIVIVPNSSEDSFWTGNWKKMITEELIPLVDAEYRTIDDARYRFTAGCSMGGQGAYGVGLTSPDYFSGAISFFGALNMARDESEDALKIAQNETEEYLKYYTMYFICGNKDSYGFGDPAIELHQILNSKGIEHGFFIENGGHDSPFYVPYFVDAIAYTRNNMYQSDEAVEKLMSGSYKVEDGNVYVTFEALDGIEEYFNLIPASTYTKDQNPDLNIPLVIEITQNGEVVYRAEIRDNDINAENLVWEYELTDVNSYVDLDAEYTVTYKAAIFDRVVELDSKTVNEEVIVDTDADVDTDVDADTDADVNTDVDADTSSEKTAEPVKTGDEAPVMMYAVVAAMAFVVAVIAFKKRRA